MAATAPSSEATGQLTSFYGEMTSLERVLAAVRVCGALDD